MILLCVNSIGDEMDNQQLSYQEIFKDFPLNRHYKIGSFGTVLSAKTGKPMKLQKTRDGYFRVGITISGKVKKYLVHRLVAKTFIRLPKEGEVVNHKDGNKENNHYLNLEWTDVSGNNKHAFSLGLNSNLGEKNPRSILTEDDVIIIYKSLLDGVSLKYLAERYCVGSSTIKSIKAKKNWGQTLKNFPDIEVKPRRSRLPKYLRDKILLYKMNGLTNREIHKIVTGDGHDIGFYQVKDVGRKFRD